MTAPPDDDDDELELTDEQAAQAKPFADAFPEIAAAMRGSRGRPRLQNPKRQVTLRLSAEVLDAYRAGGPGWQVRINQTLEREVRSCRLAKAASEPLGPNKK